MAQLKDSIVQGDLRVTGTIYGNMETDQVTLSDSVHANVLEGVGVVGKDAGASASPRYIPGTWTFSWDGELKDGDIFFIKIPVDGTTAVWMSVDEGTTYHPIALHNTSRLTTQYPVGTYISVIYQSTGTVSTYALGGADSAATVTGIFRVLNYYDANTTYSAMSVAEMKAGTATSARTIRADYLKSAFTNSTDGVIRTGTESGTLKVFGTDIQVKDCGDFIITATVDNTKMHRTQNYDDYSLSVGTSTESAISFDKTVAEFNAAITEGKNIYIVSNFPLVGTRIPLTNLTSSVANFSVAQYGTSSGIPRMVMMNIMLTLSSGQIDLSYFVIKPLGISGAAESNSY